MIHENEEIPGNCNTGRKSTNQSTFQLSELSWISGSKMSFVSSDHFVKVTSKMRKSGRLSDAKILLDDGSTFKIHKMLLAMGSSFFEMLFSRETGKTEYKISMVTFEVMDQILDWMYCHKMALTEENLPEILKTANYLDCFEVVDQCSK